MDVNGIAALIAAVAAISAPVITAIVNNRHEYKMRKLEYQFANKSKALQEFMQAFSELEASGFDITFDDKNYNKTVLRFFTAAANLSTLTNSIELSEKIYQCGRTVLQERCIYGNCLKQFEECLQLIRTEMHLEKEKLRHKQRSRQ